MDEVPGLIVKLAENPAEQREAAAVRFRVFVEEQGVPPEEEYDEYDSVAVHAIALQDRQVIGTGRFYSLESGEARIGRMAVDATWRRSGVGGIILSLLEEEARRQGLRAAVLHAQTYVQAFYAGHGYLPVGPVFMEAGIEHVTMRKTLA